MGSETPNTSAAPEPECPLPWCSKPDGHGGLHGTLASAATRAEDCGAVGNTGPCCKAKGHAGPHLRPLLTWDEWGAICGASGNYGAHMEPLACAYPAGHDGPHAWASLPTFVNGKPVTDE